MPPYSIRRCTVDDAATMASLAARLFTETYGPTHPEPELSRYLARSFSVEGIREEIAAGGVTMFLAEDSEGKAIAYAYMRSSADPPPGVDGNIAREIVRFYVDGAVQGRGLGASLMAECFKDARRRSADVIWLQVWKEAPWAVRFYARMGFSVVGSAPFYFGDQIGDDHIMAKSLFPLFFSNEIRQKAVTAVPRKQSLEVKISIQPRKWRRSMPLAWKQTQLGQPAKIAGCITISALNVLWQGHGILRSSPTALRLAVVGVLCYGVTTIAEFLWLMYSGPKFTGFESRTAAKGAPLVPVVDPLVEQLKDLPPAELRDEVLELAKEMKSFEAVADREFVNTLAGVHQPIVATEAERDEVLDQQSAELVEHNLRTWRAYRERFYRPARAFRDELRKRLGIRNVNSEPRIPALDQAVLTGAKPIAQAADYLASLARRLK